MQSSVLNGIQLGNAFSSLLRTRADLFDILTPPAFGLTVFRIRAPTEQVEPGAANETGTRSAFDAMSSEALTRDVSETINRRGEIFLTSTVVAGHFVIRVVSANPMAEEKYVRRAFEILVSVAEEAMRSSGGLEQGEERN
jgi:aromatic-L-amino-acid decarboxylase